MFRRTSVALTIVLGVAAGSYSFAADTVPAHIAGALTDQGRPQKDKDRDAERKPGEILSFIGIKAGDKVVDFIAGDGYFTRLFSKAVGPTGKVYAVSPNELNALLKTDASAATKAIAADAAYKNVTALSLPINEFKIPESVDVVWIRQNYHDYYFKPIGVTDAAALNKAIYNSLKPGGLYVIVDHAAKAGSGVEAATTLHRYDVEAVKKEVVAAGFRFEGESPVLHNPADDLSKSVFDASLRGHTDQYVLKFRK
ncbi:MAG: class I SAM-dependent methyltransferase [Proteobacteria bacterium]|nr:class I SAM-dependent methyltransferase [Pseudomonadota bacterium]